MAFVTHIRMREVKLIYCISNIKNVWKSITKLRQWDFFTHWLTHYIKLECFERNRLVTCLIYLSAKYVPLRSRFKGIWICALKIQTNPNNIGLNKKNRPYNIVRLRNNRRVFVIMKRLLYRLMIKITFGNIIQYCVYLKTPANYLDKKSISLLLFNWNSYWNQIPFYL